MTIIFCTSVQQLVLGAMQYLPVLYIDGVLTAIADARPYKDPVWAERVAVGAAKRLKRKLGKSQATVVVTRRRISHRHWEAEANRLARMAAPHISACDYCGSPKLDGYVCTHCAVPMGKKVG